MLILLAADHSGALHVPLIQRTDDGGPHARQIAFPGGRKERQDADLVETALRESQEEIALDRNRVEIHGELTPLWIPVSGHVVHPVVGEWKDSFAALRQSLVPQPAEVDRIILAPLAELLMQRVLQTVDARGTDMEAPCFVWADVTVWGATAAILSELRELALGVAPAANPAIPDRG